jgi:multicomponent Na+:H+ antiporter subunit D
MTGSWLHPALVLISGGLILPLLPGMWRSIVALVLPLAVLVIIWTVPDGSHISISFLQYQLDPFHVDKLSRLFITVFSITAFAGVLYCCKQAGSRELSAALVYAGSAIGVTLAGDLITLFVFWEIMALASTLVVWSARTDASWNAGMRYIILHLLGGVILMGGIAAYSQETGSIVFTTMQPESSGTWLILTGFLINAGAPPLSAWIADAYPESSFSGMVFLSAFTTKTAVYVLLRGYPGTELLIHVGLFMIFYGMVYALLENDVRRLLAYSIVNQIGFMLCGIGIGTEIALNGAAAQAFTHIIYKALLLMSAGSVLYMTGKRNCTDLGGLFRTMPLTAICGIIGALAISAFPWTSGFVSKSMLTQAAADEQLQMAWLLLMFASAGAFVYVGIKFPWLVFFHQDSGLRPEEPPFNMRAAMVLTAVMCILIGIAPGLLYQLLPYNVDYQPYTPYHVLQQLQLLLFAGLAFFITLPWIQKMLTRTVDFDWFYRKALFVIWQVLAGIIVRIYDLLCLQTQRATDLVYRKSIRFYGMHGLFSRQMQTGTVALLAVLFLAAYLLFYLIHL